MAALAFSNQHRKVQEAPRFTRARIKRRLRERMRGEHQRLVASVHGTLACNRSGCRCLPCRAVKAAYDRDRNLARAAGTWRGRVKAIRARAHIVKLRRLGIGIKSISEASDVPARTLKYLYRRIQLHVLAHTEARILAVRVPFGKDGCRVDGRRAARRIAMLIEEGYTKHEIAQRARVHVGTISPLRPYIRLKTAHRIERAYLRLTA